MSSRPPVTLPEPWSFPTPSTHTLPNGMPAHIFALPGQKVTSTRVLVPVTAAAEPVQIEGVGAIVSRTMDEGTQQHDADQLAELFERGGIGLSAARTARGIVLDLEATTTRARTGWQLALECLREPVFPDNEVDRHVRQRIAEIDHEHADPASRGTLAWLATFYDPSSRASRPLSGSRESVRRIDAQAARAFHAAHVRPDEAQVVVCGDVDVDEVVDGLSATFGSWARSEAQPEPADASTERLAENRARIVFVDRPGSVQTDIQLGWQGPSRRVEGGWAPYPVLGMVIGGSPQARLDAVLREERGYTYGMRAGFRPRVHDGVFAVSGSVRADVTAPALELTLQVLAEANKGFSPEEIGAAVEFIAGTAPGRYATAEVICDEASTLLLDGLHAHEFVTGYLADLRTVTPERASEAWRRYSGQAPTIVLVGDADAHAGAVEALGMPVEVIPS